MLPAIQTLTKKTKYIVFIGALLCPHLVYALPSGVKEITQVEGVTEYELNN